MTFQWTAILVVVGMTLSWVGCEPQSNSTVTVEAGQTEENHQRLVTAVPPPRLTTSLERKNLVRRLERLNKEDAISYVYLVSYGKVMAFYTVRGKISSLNSLLTTPEQIVKRYIGGHSEGFVLTSPDFDGSYGKNAEGVFFFTTEGVYVEWQGEYLWADQPLKLSQPPELVVNVTKP